MGDYMKCDKCGYLLIEGDNFCRNCGKTITNIQQQVNISQQVNIPQQVPAVKNIKDDNGKANLLCVLSLLLYFLAPIIFIVIDIVLALLLENANYLGVSGFSVLCRLAGFILMIVARVKYPNNIFAKVLMWIYIALIIAGLVFGLIIFLLIILALISL